ncbi:MAG: hypothetical protein OEY33_08740, partial [Bdellovibrionales bacterium]|nr:hypothetical protein [Bdellovibrionales bacterium]
MNKVISATNNKSKYKYSQGENTDTMLNPDLNWKRAETGAPILRGGKDIFSAMSSLIASAEKEVLIQTFIFDFASSVAQDYVFKGIIELYNKHKAKMDKGLAKDPVVVRLVFDVIGGFKGLNFNEIFINTRFAGGAIKHWKNISSSRASFGEDPDYEIQFPTKPVLDPKVLRFEIKGHRHDVFPNMVNVNHSKSIAVDRTVAIVTGANIIDYHLTNEYKTPQNKELMVDHGFYVFDSAALMVADDFYNLWYKDEKSHRKWSGWSSQYNGNVEVDRYLKYDGRPFVGLSGSAKKNGRVNLFKRKFINKDWDSSISKKILIGVVGRDAGKGNKYPKSPQNDAFLAILKNAKSHVNIISP